MQNHYLHHSFINQHVYINPQIIKNSQDTIMTLLGENHPNIQAHLKQSVKQIINHGLSSALLAQNQIDRISLYGINMDKLVQLQHQSSLKLQHGDQSMYNSGKRDFDQINKSLKQKTSVDINNQPDDLILKFEQSQSRLNKLGHLDIRNDNFSGFPIEDQSWF